ncbi:MAG: MerR family transcriptional regulator [bacterium]|nr:MerR family transcriptional regulator [bacterium]
MKPEEMLALPRQRSAKAPKLYSIGQVHAITGIPKPTIRYWEKEFESYLEPLRTTGNQRRYDDKAIADLEKINYLVKVQGYTLDGAKRKLEMLRKVDVERPQSNDPMAELARAMSDYLLKKLSRD